MLKPGLLASPLHGGSAHARAHTRTHAHTVQVQPPQELRRPVCPINSSSRADRCPTALGPTLRTPLAHPTGTVNLSSESPSGRQEPVPLLLLTPASERRRLALRTGPSWVRALVGRARDTSQPGLDLRDRRLRCQARCSGSHTKPRSCQPQPPQATELPATFFFFFFGVLSEAPTPSRHLKAFVKSLDLSSRVKSNPPSSVKPCLGTLPPTFMLPLTRFLIPGSTSGCTPLPDLPDLPD